MPKREEYIAQLEANHSFPGEFTFKLVALNRDGFEDDARAAVAELLPAATPAISSRLSKTGKHVSLTVTLNVASAEQTADLYARFHALDGLHLML